MHGELKSNNIIHTKNVDFSRQVLKCMYIQSNSKKKGQMLIFINNLQKSLNQTVS